MNAFPSITWYRSTVVAECVWVPSLQAYSWRQHILLVNCAFGDCVLTASDGVTVLLCLANSDAFGAELRVVLCYVAPDTRPIASDC